MTAMLIIVLCAASAVLGRLLLTRDQAWRTITVRLPAVAGLLLNAIAAIACWALWFVLCFIVGSFYGIANWWWPQLSEVLEIDGTWLGPIITGRWQP